MSKESVTNFLAKYRDKKTKSWKNFTAKEFMEVWDHYDSDGNGYIEGEELDGFLKEFVKSVVQSSDEDIGQEVLSNSMIATMKEQFMEAYDENEDNRIEIGELAQMLPTDETFLLLFRRDNPLESSVDFMRIWKQVDKDNSGYIESDELEEFLKLLLQEAKQEVSPKKLGEYADTILKLFDQNGDGMLQMSEMAKLLPVKENFLSRPMFKHASKITETDINRIFNKYDSDKSGTIEGIELEGFIKDLLECTGGTFDGDISAFENILVNNNQVTKKELKMILLQQKRMAEEEEISQSKLDDDFD